MTTVTVFVSRTVRQRRKSGSRLWLQNYFHEVHSHACIRQNYFCGFFPVTCVLNRSLWFSATFAVIRQQIRLMRKLIVDNGTGNPSDHVTSALIFRLILGIFESSVTRKWHMYSEISFVIDLGESFSYNRKTPNHRQRRSGSKLIWVALKFSREGQILYSWIIYLTINNLRLLGPL